MSSESEETEVRTEIEQDVDAFAAIINGNYKNENDRITLCSLLMSRVIEKTSITKVISHGVPELLACNYIGLQWNGTTVHGRDATDKKGNAVEIKTYKQVKNSKQINIMYPLLKHQDGESDDSRRKRIFEDFMDDRKYAGGHYWVSFNKTKQNVRWYNFIDKNTLAKLIDEHLKVNSQATTKNFGGSLCKKCGRCHAVDKVSKLYSKTALEPSC